MVRVRGSERSLRFNLMGLVGGFLAGCWCPPLQKSLCNARVALLQTGCDCRPVQELRDRVRRRCQGALACSSPHHYKFTICDFYGITSPGLDSSEFCHNGALTFGAGACRAYSLRNHRPRCGVSRVVPFNDVKMIHYGQDRGTFLQTTRATNQDCKDACEAEACCVGIEWKSDSQVQFSITMPPSSILPHALPSLPLLVTLRKKNKTTVSLDFATVSVGARLSLKANRERPLLLVAGFQCSRTRLFFTIVSW